jgi:hypothetical protein
MNKDPDLESYPDSIFFGEFDPDRWPIHEETVLRPQLEREGYSDIQFVFDLESEGTPHRRVCICTDKDGILRKLVYGPNG